MASVVNGWRLGEPNLEALLRGAVVMGTGGGGSPEFGREIMKNDLARGRSYNIVNLSDVPEDALVCSGGIMGSVAVLDRLSPEDIVNMWEDRFEPLVALRTLEAVLGREVEYVVPFELGALNTPVILSLAARLGIGVIDGDGVGRSAPETQMTSFYGHGVSIVPMPLADAKGNVLVVSEGVTPFFPDEVGRFVVTRAGGMGANAHYPMTGLQAHNAVLPDTISFAVELGQALLGISDSNEAALITAERTGGQLAFEGRVRSLREEAALGFLIQTATLDGVESSAGSTMEIVIKNEFMLASVNGQIGCVFPDLIVLIDENGRGVMSSELAEGQIVRVVVAPCHPHLRAVMETPRAREALGAARFGRPEVAYEPLEELSQAWGLSWPTR